LSEREFFRTGHDMRVTRMSWLGKGGGYHCCDVRCVNKGMARVAQGQGQGHGASEHRGAQEPFIEVLVEPIRSHDRPVETARADRLLGTHQPLVAHYLDGLAGKQDNVFDTGSHGLCHEIGFDRLAFWRHEKKRPGTIERWRPRRPVSPVEADVPATGGRPGFGR
jgi:hypothetical protein